MRNDREDLTEQRAAVDRARTALADAAADLASEATTVARAAGRKTGRPDLDPVHTAYRALTAAEEAADLAGYDLHTAAGGDG